jgi:LacI family transcriptional regulator, fructose operon transcriptional repressor
MKPPARKTTIYDIARISGASPSTVSAVLNGTWASRRIGAATVDTIQEIALKEGYSINLQARGLRQARSGLVGMIIPEHENRFFSSLSQNFDTLARERGLCPVIASTLRNSGEERRVVETFISYAVDAIFIAGASDPEQLGALCAAANLKHIFVDLPGHNAPSVVTDNFNGARQLTEIILNGMPEPESSVPHAPYFLGGSITDHATAKRLAGFRSAIEACGRTVTDGHVIQCGYESEMAAREIRKLCDRLGELPRGLFVNSLTVFEGVMAHFVNLSPSAFERSAIGCFDYDPLAAFLQFPVFMIRQDSYGLIAKAYELFDADETSSAIYEVKPQMIAPRTMAVDSRADSEARSPDNRPFG